MHRWILSNKYIYCIFEDVYFQDMASYLSKVLTYPTFILYSVGGDVFGILPQL